MKRTVGRAETTARVPDDDQVTPTRHAVRALTGLQVGDGRRHGLGVWT